MSDPTPRRQPWLKYYPGDWRADEGLAQCTLAARGLWIEMINIMHKSHKYGHLLIAGIRPTDAQIATQVHSDTKSVCAGIAELEKWGVLSRDSDGVIFSRRMIRDAQKQARDVENGRGGGNPNLGPGVNPPDNPGLNQTDKPLVNGVDKAQMPDARKLASESKKAPFASLTPTKPSAVEPSDARSRLFQHGTAMVRDMTGRAEPSCRALVGKWLGTLGDDCAVLLAILDDANASRPAEPVAWINAAVDNRVKPRLDPHQAQLERIEAAMRAAMNAENQGVLN